MIPYRTDTEVDPTPPPSTTHLSTAGDINNLNVIGLFWILAVVVCAATATAATIVVAAVLKVTNETQTCQPGGRGKSPKCDPLLRSLKCPGKLGFSHRPRHSLEEARK